MNIGFRIALTGVVVAAALVVVAWMESEAGPLPAPVRVALGLIAVAVLLSILGGLIFAVWTL